MTPKKKIPASQGKSREYEVGYKRPPKHSRWKPGQSGNPKGYVMPKNVRELNNAIDGILAEQEEIKKGKKLDKLRITINRLLLSPNPAGPIYILDRRFGKVKDEVVISSDSIEQLLQYLPDDLLERIAQGEKIGDVLVEWIATLRESKTNSTRKG
jgi:hypothetical protein